MPDPVRARRCYWRALLVGRLVPGQKVVAGIGATPARKGVGATEPEADLTGAKVFTMQYDGSNRDETAALSKKFDTLFLKS
jgi:hypothetical protein